MNRDNKTKEIHHVLIRDIMSRKVVSVTPDTTLLEASKIMIKDEFNGLPVVDNQKKVIGIVTEYDFLTKGTAIHIPTYIRLMSETPKKKKDRDGLLKESFAEMIYFTVRDVMNKDPIIMWEGSTFSNILRVFSEHHRVNPIPIVDAKGVLVGIVSRFDIIKFFSKILQEFKPHK